VDEEEHGRLKESVYLLDFLFGSEETPRRNISKEIFF
jgi:hypothetical protein